MNKIKTKRLICTPLSIIILGTTVFIGGIPRVDAYAADDTNAAISTATPILVGAGKMVGVLKSVQYVNDSNYYGDVVVATITNGNGDYSYFAEVGTQLAEDLKNTSIGQNITINYVTGTPVQCDSKGAFPITSISTAIKQTTYTDSQGIIYQLNENGNTAIINSQTGISGDIVIPQEVTANGEQYTVTGIGENAFGKCSNLKSIVIPDSVTRIGQYAFYGCTNLENVTLPNNLTAIEERIFSGCSSLKSIILPGNIKDIGYNAFYGCDSLLSLTIPSSLTFIGNNTADRLSYVTTFIMKQNNNNFTTEDGVIFSRENPSATATPVEPGYREICGGGNITGTIKSTGYVKYDYSGNGTYKDYLILTIINYQGYETNWFTEKDSDDCKKIEQANVGQHIEFNTITIEPMYYTAGKYAAVLSSAVLAKSTETATSTVVATSTETAATSTTVATSTETAATSTVVGTSTETVATSTTVANSTETVATSTETSSTSTTVEAGTATIATSTGTTTAGNAKTGDAASLMAVAMFMAGSAGIMLKKQVREAGKK